MRLGEIGGLRNRDVNLAEGWVRIRSSYSFAENRIKNTTKNKKYRLIEMNEDMREILWRRRHVPESKPVFNVKMNSIKFFSRTCRWAGVREIHFHALRHTCLTNLANGYGMDKPLPITQVQKIAGHADIKMTQRYVHTHGIEGTGSGQWSRAERIVRKSEDECGRSPDRLPASHSLDLWRGDDGEEVRSTTTSFPGIKKLRLIKTTNQSSAYS